MHTVQFCALNSAVFRYYYVNLTFSILVEKFFKNIFGRASTFLLYEVLLVPLTHSLVWPTPHVESKAYES